MGSIDGMYKIVITRDLGPNVMPVLKDKKEFNLIVCPDSTKDRQQWIIENVPGAAGLLCMLSDKITAEIIEAAGPTLKVVSTMSVGYDHVNLPTLKKLNIRLGYTPDILTNAVADLSVMLALMASRNARECMDTVQNGQWPNSPWTPFGFCGPQISVVPNETQPGKYSQGRTVGFFGFGRIAQATLARLVPFGVSKFIYTGNPSAVVDQATLDRDAAIAKSVGLPSDAISRVSLDDLASQSDVLFVLAPGGASTYHAIDASFLSKMKSTSVLVNASRGTIVDSDALAAALRSGQIWGAGLDVVEGEPHITTEHPLVKESRCVVFPHVASATTETRIGIGRLAAFNVISGVFGDEMPSELQIS
ncbi:glyoxylate reductase [Pyrrhoderma noxium]|uniref:Glyoxylate reductase n=1 Tax=Pyrrhoderma noxium TaxID=2282107 RepID=A0A286UJH9_9AGAM|nr:glyoxylate reductase [Pyrrhoderma noxium]